MSSRKKLWKEAGLEPGRGGGRHGELRAGPDPVSVPSAWPSFLVIRHRAEFYSSSTFPLLIRVTFQGFGQMDILSLGSHILTACRSFGKWGSEGSEYMRGEEERGEGKEGLLEKVNREEQATKIHTL